MKDLREFLEADKPAAHALKKLSELLLSQGGRLLLVGGAARDILMHGRDAEPRDFDLVVNGIELEPLLAPLEPRRNGFGAFQFDYEGTAFDAWQLADTWGLKFLGISDPNMDDFMRAMFFNIDCVALELPTGALYDGGFAQGLKDKVLEVNFPHTLFPGACLVRTALYSKRFGLRLGPKLEDWVLSERPRFRARVLIESHRNHDPRYNLSARELLKPLNDACIAAERRRRAGGVARIPARSSATPRPAIVATPATPQATASEGGKRIAWTPLSAIEDPSRLTSPFLPAVVSFWRRVQSVARELFDDFDARLGSAGKFQPELEEVLRGPLDVDAIRRVHAIVTRDQAAVPARLTDGTWRHVALAHGQFKERPNEIRQKSGNIQEFCPPALVVSELGRILTECERIPKEYLDVRAAWLSAGINSVHPFIDGNGRVSRVLGSIELMQAGLPLQRASFDVRGPGFIEANVVSFDDLAPMSKFYQGEAEAAVAQSLVNIERATRVETYEAAIVEKDLVELCRERFKEDLTSLALRDAGWRSATEEAVAEATRHGCGEANIERGTPAPDVVDRLAPYGFRLRPEAHALTARVPLEAPGWDCTFDYVPVGGLGVGAYWGVASFGARGHRERAPQLLLLTNEDPEPQRHRVREWAGNTLVKAVARSILYAR